MREKSQFSLITFPSKYLQRHIPEQKYSYVHLLMRKWNMKPFICLLHGFWVSYINHQQQKSRLLQPPSSDLSSVPNITSHIFWMRMKRWFLFFHLSPLNRYGKVFYYYLPWEKKKKITRNHSIMQKNSDTGICLACSQRFSFHFFPPGFLLLTICWLCPLGLVIFLQLIVVSAVFT